MQSIMQHSFSQVPKADVPRSSFNRSAGLKTTFDAGYLVPIFVDEALPGDTFNARLNAFARLATPLHPFMDNLFMDTHFFAVPIRLVFDNFQKMMGEQVDPGDSTDYILPEMTSPAGGYDNQTIHDYLGLPTKVAGITHTAIYHRAYNLIWNEWFRDQNLQDSVSVPRGDGPDAPTLYTLLRRGKRHDYFTSGLPWPQKGPAINLPLGQNAPVVSNGQTPTLAGLTGDRNLTFTATSGVGYSGAAAGATTNARFGVQTGLTVDLSDATAATINQLREAFQVQKLYERDARGGSRYTEIIRSHFGVVSPDARLQRPEYLGGGSTPINVNPIAQTSATDATTPQGNLAGIGTASIHGHGFTKSFTEHCIIIGLVSVRADLTYQQGLDRMFSRSTRMDFYWPAFSHLGEQAILNKEIMAQGTAADENVFAYQERNAEYRYKASKVTGKFRSNDPQSLDNWHLSQDFASLPVLNAEFIQENPPVDRVIAVQDEPHFLFDSYMHLKCARPMPVYSVPGLIDHF
jgi:hypothetical protein